MPNVAARKLKNKTFPAPVRGWIANENLALAQPGGAWVLDGWFPNTTTIRIMGGSVKWATISEDPVLSMFTYSSSVGDKFFAADAENIFDITTPASTTVIPTAAVSGQSSGYYSTTQMNTAGGNYLYAVNGTDDAQLFDGSAWQAVNSGSSPIAITGVDTDDLSYAWTFASRLFFIQSGTMDVWFLGVDSIGGTATKFSLAGVMQEGGELLFGATWSLDAGDGLDDKCVFVSSRGEVAVYEGTNPADADAWSKVGVYQITVPLGSLAHIRAGGDLLVATQEGIVPLSEAIRKDAAALSLAAVSRNIEPEWRSEVSRRRTLPWKMVKWAANNMLLVSQPAADATQPSQCLIANLETGAWCKRTGWDTRCIAVFNERGFFGANDGAIYEMDVSGADDGEPYTAVVVGLFDHMGTPGYQKTVMQARTIYRSAAPFNDKISISRDYAVSLPSAPSSIADYVVDEWDVGQWDVALWDAGTDYTVTSQWRSIGQSGFAIAPQIQITSGTTPKPRIELVSIDLTYEQGAIVV